MQTESIELSPPDSTTDSIPSDSGSDASASDTSISDTTAFANEPTPPSVEVGPNSLNGSPSEPAVETPLPLNSIDNSPEFQDMLSVIMDKTLELKPRELPAYWRLFREAEGATFESLYSSAKVAPKLNDLMLHPANFRAGLFQQQLVVRSVRSFPEPENSPEPGKLIYEIWGSNEMAPQWLQVVVSASLPPDQTSDTLQGKSIDIAGYFFKLQAYYPAASKSSDRPMISPLYIGKIQLAPEQDKSSKSPSFVSNGTMFAILAGLIICSFLIKNLVRMPIRRKTGKGRGDSWNWLEDEKGKNPSSSDADSKELGTNDSDNLR